MKCFRSGSHSLLCFAVLPCSSWFESKLCCRAVLWHTSPRHWAQSFLPKGCSDWRASGSAQEAHLNKALSGHSRDTAYNKHLGHGKRGNCVLFRIDVDTWKHPKFLWKMTVLLTAKLTLIVLFIWIETLENKDYHLNLYWWSPRTVGFWSRMNSHEAVLLWE